MNVFKLLDELTVELSDKKGFSRKRANENRCLEIVDQLKSHLVKVYNKAQEIVNSRQKILTNADLVAKNVIKEAEIRAKRLASDTEIIKQAERAGRDALNKTYRECDELVIKTKEHLDTTFREAEKYFLAMLETIRTNRNELREIFTKKEK